MCMMEKGSLGGCLELNIPIYGTISHGDDGLGICIHTIESQCTLFILALFSSVTRLIPCRNASRSFVSWSIVPLYKPIRNYSSRAAVVYLHDDPYKSALMALYIHDGCESKTMNLSGGNARKH